MQNNVEPWMEICELASKEQDPARLMELTNEIIRLLEEKKNMSRAAVPVVNSQG
jgi:hypothetical protein